MLLIHAPHSPGQQFNHEQVAGSVWLGGSLLSHSGGQKCRRMHIVSCKAEALLQGALSGPPIAWYPSPAPCNNGYEGLHQKQAAR
eukprot:4529604-Amphidinium_carterae.2